MPGALPLDHGASRHRRDSNPYLQAHSTIEDDSAESNPRATPPGL